MSHPSKRKGGKAPHPSYGKLRLDVWDNAKLRYVKQETHDKAGVALIAFEKYCAICPKELTIVLYAFNYEGSLVELARRLEDGRVKRGIV